jgi:hypothetical protein
MQRIQRCFKSKVTCITLMIFRSFHLPNNKSRPQMRLEVTIRRHVHFTLKCRLVNQFAALGHPRTVIEKKPNQQIKAANAIRSDNQRTRTLHLEMPVGQPICCTQAPSYSDWKKNPTNKSRPQMRLEVTIKRHVHFTLKCQLDLEPPDITTIRATDI